jgi:hypothetical protein
MARPTDTFAFRPEETPCANVSAFFKHMETRDKELAALLRDNLATVLDSAERDRSEARKRFNRSIADALDGEQAGQKGKRL